MQAILNVKPVEINDNLLTIIQELLLKNVEIIIRKEIVKLNEYDKSIPFKSRNYDKKMPNPSLHRTGLSPIR